MGGEIAGIPFAHQGEDMRAVLSMRLITLREVSVRRDSQRNTSLRNKNIVLQGLDHGREDTEKLLCVWVLQRFTTDPSLAFSK